MGQLIVGKKLSFFLHSKRKLVYQATTLEKFKYFAFTLLHMFERHKLPDTFGLLIRVRFLQYSQLREKIA